MNNGQAYCSSAHSSTRGTRANPALCRVRVRWKSVLLDQQPSLLTLRQRCSVFNVSSSSESIRRERARSPSLTMSAVSSTFRAHDGMHSKKSAISLSLKLLLLLCQPRLARNQFPVRNSVRPIHLFDHNCDHDY